MCVVQLTMAASKFCTILIIFRETKRLCACTGSTLKMEHGCPSPQCQWQEGVWLSRSWEVLSSVLEVARHLCSTIWQKGAD